MFTRYQWMFAEPETATRSQVFRWWEDRRGNYNLLLLCVGIVTWILVLVVGSLAVKPGVDFEEPIAMIFGPPIYALLANICFTAGPIFDILFYVERPRLQLFKTGLYFSLALTALPGIWAVVAWLITVYTGKKLD
jgi:hypothetical protein